MKLWHIVVCTSCWHVSNDVY